MSAGQGSDEPLQGRMAPRFPWGRRGLGQLNPQRERVCSGCRPQPPLRGGAVLGLEHPDPRIPGHVGVLLDSRSCKLSRRHTISTLMSVLAAVMGPLPGCSLEERGDQAVLPTVNLQARPSLGPGTPSSFPAPPSGVGCANLNLGGSP